ncbi:DNA-directed RNA polymerase III subunit rpc1 [Histomonas meleagridis]|nr:DNA-directed RNA polymerase III subunit rpc1 [Histomonas meleagridis]
MDYSYLQKERVPNSTAPKRINEIDFQIIGSSETRKMSAVTINKCDFYESTSNKPVSGGVLDLRLGTTSREFPCQTCGNNEHDCPGHFGSIEFVLPVFNTGYYPHIINVLKCICKTCSHVLLPKSEINKRLRRIYSNSSSTIYNKIERVKALKKETETVVVCPHCGALNGPIRKSKNLLIITHDIGLRNEVIKSQFAEQFVNLNLPDVKYDSLRNYISEDLTPVRVLNLFDNIPLRELPLLMSNVKIENPSNMIIKSMIVPPNSIRPSVISSGEGSTEDDLTIRLREAIDTTIQLQKSIEAGHTSGVIAEKWCNLQQIINTFINSEGPDTIMKKKGKKDKPIIGISQRLKGKKGRFRTNLCGKRVNFSGRTVITPDPNANVDQVVVPLEMAMTLTFPTVVTKHNINMLKKCIKNGPFKYPGANQVLTDDHKFKRSLRYLRQEEIDKVIHNLKYGDIVERHLINNDTVLFNRQPSLHRISIMAFRAKVMPWRTLRFNVCACAPFNADFDGDEMNIHLPQTLEAAADARILMNVLSNLFSPRNGELIVAPTQDFLSGTYLLTRKNVFLDYQHFTFLAAQIFDADVPLEIPMPSILYPTPLWTGKQLISLMISPNSQSNIKFTHNVTNKEYTGNLHMCKNDGYVSFLDSYMLSGVLEKSLIGGGSKSIFSVLARDYSPQYSAICMARISKISVRFLMNRGFSIGITDVTPNPHLEDAKDKIIEEAYKKSEQYINQMNSGKFEANPGMSVESSLELSLNNTLSQVRNDIGKLCLKELSNLNTALVMAKSGAKGSDINICQMMACVGQQIISGQRIIEDFIDRTIPHFHHKSLEPYAKGFVPNSFFSGLTPYEFFFHTMSGREGLVDAAVKTAETGYLQRRLVKSLEDAIVQYDGTVRSGNTIVQFVYGDDGLDPLCMEVKGFPLDLKRVSFEIIERMKHLLDENKQNLEEVRAKLFEYTIKTFETSIRNQFPLTEEYLNEFITYSIKRIEKSLIEPGTTVGAIAAQSIGEPATQMTLKSFHFAGVASMNVTLGVPRIQEIMNAVKNIKTPCIEAYLINDHDEIAAQVIRGNIDRILLGQITKLIQEVECDSGCYINIILDMKTITDSKLNITPETVIRSILKSKKLGIKEENITKSGIDSLQISFGNISSNSLQFLLQQLMLKLPLIPVSGLDGIKRVIISKSDDLKYKLYIESNSFLDVLTTNGVNYKKTISNHILDVEKVLGIEAARTVILNEIKAVYNNYGLSIDLHHLLLLADIMTLKGKINGINRHGLAKTSSSSLKLASFEVTMEHLYNAGFHQVDDNTNGATASTILGSFAKLGSGMMDVMIAKDLIQKPVLGVGELLTPQPPSEYRGKIEKGEF